MEDQDCTHECNVGLSDCLNHCPCQCECPSGCEGKSRVRKIDDFLSTSCSGCSSAFCNCRDGNDSLEYLECQERVHSLDGIEM